MKRLVAGVALLLVAALLAATARVAVPRVRRARELGRLIELTRSPDRDAVVRATERLLDVEETEAVLAQLAAFERDERHLQPAVMAVELQATAPDRDPRVAREVERIAREHARDSRGAWASYLLEELASPLHGTEPPTFAATGERVAIAARCPLEEAVAAITARVPVQVEVGDRAGETYLAIEDRPWRALVRAARSAGARVVRDGDRLRLERMPLLEPALGPRVSWLAGDDGRRWVLIAAPLATLARCRRCAGGFALDPEKALRASVAGSGLALERRGERLFVARDERPEAAVLAEARARAGEPGFLEAVAEQASTGAIAALVPLASQDDGFRALRFAVELHALGEVDPRARAELERFAREARSVDLRFLALYLLEELRDPTHARAPDDVPREPEVALWPGTTGEAIVTLASALGPRRLELGARQPEHQVETVGAPWPVLVRFAQRLRERVVVRPDSIALEPVPFVSFADAAALGPAALGDELVLRLDRKLALAPGVVLDVSPTRLPAVEPLRALRALAALNGCGVRERVGGLELFKR